MATRMDRSLRVARVPPADGPAALVSRLEEIRRTLAEADAARRRAEASIARLPRTPVSATADATLAVELERLRAAVDRLSAPRPSQPPAPAAPLAAGRTEVELVEPGPGDDPAALLAERIRRRVDDGWRVLSTATLPTGVTVLVVERSAGVHVAAVVPGPAPSGVHRGRGVARPGRRSAAIAAGVACLGAAGLAAALLVDTGDEAGRAANAVPAAAPAGAGADLEPCARVPRSAEASRTVVCATRSRILHVTRAPRPLDLPGLRVRVVSTARTPEGRTATLELRNRSGRDITLRTVTDRLYLGANGERVTASVMSGAGLVQDGSSRRVVARFDGAPEGPADLGVRLVEPPPGERARIGVIRIAS